MTTIKHTPLASSHMSFPQTNNKLTVSGHMLKTDLGGWPEVPITRVQSPECRPRTQNWSRPCKLAASKTVTDARGEELGQTWKARRYQDTSTKWVQAAGPKYQPRPHAVVQAELSIIQRDSRKAESVVNVEADAEPGNSNLVQQAEVQRGRPTTKKIRRLKEEKATRALQRAISDTTDRRNQTKRRVGQKPPRGRTTVNRQKH